MLGTLYPGRREGFLPSLALGYLLAPFQGSRRSSGLLPLHIFIENGQSLKPDWSAGRTGRPDLFLEVGRSSGSPPEIRRGSAA